MCVPYGKMLRGKIVPNTVTKTIHTDQGVHPRPVRELHGGLPQLLPHPQPDRMIKSFNRPVILVDDIMHPGFRH